MKRYAVPVTEEFIIFELVDKRMGGDVGCADTGRYAVATVNRRVVS